MKKTLKISLFILLLLLSVASFFAACPGVAFAESEDFRESGSYFARVEKNGVFFFSEDSSADMSAVFEIPQGYYVFVIGEKGEYLLCEYAKSENGFTKLVGYVLAADVNSESAYVSPSFPTLVATTITASNLYSKPSFSSDILLATYKGQKAYLYGFSLSKAYVYAKIGNDFGYILPQNLDEVYFPPHPYPVETPATVEKDEESPPSENLDAGDNTGLLTIISFAIAIPSLFIIFLLFSKPKKDVKTLFPPTR